MRLGSLILPGVLGPVLLDHRLPPQDPLQGQQNGAGAVGLRGEAYTNSAALPGPSTSTAVEHGEVASTRRAVEVGTLARAVISPSQTGP